MVSRRVSSACVCFCTIIALAPTVFGVPANRRIWTFTQPDGTRFQATLHGDEFYLYHQTLDGEIIVQDRDTGEWFYAQPRADGTLRKTSIRVGQDRIAIAASNEKSEWLSAVRRLVAQKALQTRGDKALSMPSAKGNIKGVLLLANFSDTSTTYTRSTFNDLMNTTGYRSYGALGSVKDYYLEVSYGQLTLQHDVFGWFSVPGPRAYYGKDDPDPKGPKDLNVRELIEEVIAKADATVNFADYDRDGDGWVDLFGVVHQGRDQQQNGTDGDSIQSHMWSLEEPMTVDGVHIQEYYIVGEKSDDDLATIGAFCHEIAHCFGLPDLYDLEDSSVAVGCWSLMDYGCYLGPYGGGGTKPCHLDPWCKSRLGWITPQVMLVAQSGVSLPRFDTHPAALLIAVDPYQDAEYFLIANRYARSGASAATGFDEYLPGSGALILHIDHDVANNNTEALKRVDVEEADGLQHLDNGTNTGDAGDLYPRGGSVFSDSSFPSSRSNGGVSTGIVVNNFTGAGTETMRCDVALQSPGYTISYDELDGYLDPLGCEDGDDYLCVRFMADQGGILERVKTYFVYDGTTNYTVSVYRQWVNDRPSGFLTRESGQHTGIGYEEIALSEPQTCNAGTEFVIEIRYNTSGGDKYPLPLVVDEHCDEKTYLSCDGTSYVHVSRSYDYPSDALVHVGLRPLSSSQTDSYEPDDSASAAKFITAGQMQNRSIHVASDVDWVRFTLTQTSAVTIDTDGASGDTQMWLYGPNSPTSLAPSPNYNDDAHANWAKLEHASTNPLSAGTYYIKVQEYDNDGKIAAYTLSLAVTPVAPVTPGDSYESDDEASAARIIAAGETQNRSIHVAGDVDWVKFTLTQASAAIIETNGASGDTEMWLYGPNSSTTLAPSPNYNDDTVYGKWAKIEHTSTNPLSAGTYYVKIQEYNNNGTIESYTISLALTWSIVGTWTVQEHWGIGLAEDSRVLDFKSDGTCEWPLLGILGTGGTWTQSDQSVSWTDPSGTRCTGTLSSTASMSGTMRSRDNLSGTWDATRQ